MDVSRQKRREKASLSPNPIFPPTHNHGCNISYFSPKKCHSQIFPLSLRTKIIQHLPAILYLVFHFCNEKKLSFFPPPLKCSNLLTTLWSWIQVTGLLIKTHHIFLKILLFQPGLWVKSLPCLQFHPGLKPSLVTSKQ